MNELSISPKSKKLLAEKAEYENGLKVEDTIRIARKIAEVFKDVDEISVQHQSIGVTPSPSITFHTERVYSGRTIPELLLSINLLGGKKYFIEEFGERTDNLDYLIYGKLFIKIPKVIEIIDEELKYLGD